MSEDDVKRKPTSLLIGMFFNLRSQAHRSGYEERLLQEVKDEIDRRMPIPAESPALGAPSSSGGDAPRAGTIAMCRGYAPFAGEREDSAIANAVRVARTQNTLVCVVHNDRGLIIHPVDDFASAWGRWLESHYRKQP